MYIDQNGDSEANYTVVALRDDSGVEFGESLKPVGHFSSDGLNIPVRLLYSMTSLRSMTLCFPLKLRDIRKYKTYD